MNLGDLVLAMQAIEIPFIGALTPEMALFVLSVAFFGFSTAICAMAVKASSGARDAREDARLMMRTVQDYAVEVRQLTARAEQADFSGKAHQETASHEGLSERLNGVRVGARADTAEATLSEDAAAIDHVADAAGNDDAETSVDAAVNDDANARLADATRAATEPRSLLSGMLRRR